MTLTMADSIDAANLPGGYQAYAGYVDGNWPDYPAIAAQFPDVPTYSVTVLGGTAVADECDCETGDLTPAEAVLWARTRMAAGASRPGIYADVSTMAAGVLPALAAAGVARASVRLRSAHYGAGEHICGPGTCGLVPVDMDGTQWTDTAPGENGSQVDASLLAADFFTPPAPAFQEDPMPQLRTGSGQRDAFAFGSSRPTSITLLSDPAGDGISQTQVRVALHGSVGGAAWMVYTVALTPAEPSHTLSVPADYDGVVFSREDDGGAVGVSFG